MSDQIIKSGKERRRLKASAKTRNIDVKIGKNGLSKNVLLEIKTILDRDKMVKVSFREDREKRTALIQSLQESKNLYNAINSELSKDSNTSLNESVNRKISNVASTGSSANLIESKTYENPQFLRMKDLMGKIG